MRIQINKNFSCFTNRACDDYFGGDIFKNGVDHWMPLMSAKVKYRKKTFSLSCRNKPVVIGIYLYFLIYADNDVHLGSFGIIIFRAYCKVKIWLTIHTHWQSLNQRQLPKTIASHRADLLPKRFSISVYWIIFSCWN